jgi:hypothetical protein
MFLDLTLIGLVITLEPVPVTAFILILSGDRGLHKGLVFILTWLAGLVAILAAVLLATGGDPPHRSSTPSTAVLAVKMALGVGLIVYGEHRRRRRRSARRTPAWMARLDSASPWTAAGLAVLLQPGGVVAAGAATVAEARLSGFASYLLLVYFCVLSTATLLVMELYTAFAPSAATALLTRIRTWMDDHQDQTVVTLSLLLGFWLLGRSIDQLVS